MFLKVKLAHIEKPDENWERFFKKVWPYYKKWFLVEGHTRSAGYLSSSEALKEHMPEFSEPYTQLCDLAGGGDLESRFLSMYCPPPYISGCSQLAWTKNDYVLTRNYDYHPKFFDGRFLSTNWLKPVMGMSDSTWGLLDGINDDGLAVSLAFGGKKITGVGFGIPILVRYILETCSNTEEAIEAIKRVPVHMAYNLTIIDAKGTYITAWLSPEEEPKFVYEAVATNHQAQIDWPEYANFSKSVARKLLLQEYVSYSEASSSELVSAFLKEPLCSQYYEKGFGTLYTAQYNSFLKTAKLIWPDKSVDISFNDFQEKTIQINLKKHIKHKLSL